MQKSYHRLLPSPPAISFWNVTIESSLAWATLERDGKKVMEIKDAALREICAALLCGAAWCIAMVGALVEPRRPPNGESEILILLENKTGRLKAPVWKQVASCKPRASSANSMAGAYEVGMSAFCSSRESP